MLLDSHTREVLYRFRPLPGHLLTVLLPKRLVPTCGRWTTPTLAVATAAGVRVGVHGEGHPALPCSRSALLCNTRTLCADALHTCR